MSPITVSRVELEALTARALERANTSAANAASTARALVQAEIDGQKASGITYEPEIGRAAIQFAIPIGKGNKAELIMNFTGVINDKMAGFYRSSYVDSVSNEKKCKIYNLILKN